MSSDTTRQQILDAAGPVFAEKGFEKATVRDICSAAGVNVAAVNYYFGDKHQLYVTTVQQAHENRAATVPLPAWDVMDSSREKLRGFVRTVMARMVGLEEAPWQTRLLMREVLAPTDACRQLIEAYFRPMMQVLLSIIDEMVPASLDASRRQQLAFSIVGQCVFYRVAGDAVSLMVDQGELEQNYTVPLLADHIADVAIAMLENLPEHWLTESSAANSTH